MTHFQDGGGLVCGNFFNKYGGRGSFVRKKAKRQPKKVALLGVGSFFFLSQNKIVTVYIKIYQYFRARILWFVWKSMTQWSVNLVIFNKNGNGTLSHLVKARIGYPV